MNAPNAQAPVDVLAGYAQDTGAFRVSNKGATELAAACAAVAELIEVADRLQHAYRLMGDDPDFIRLRAALARVQGGAK